MAPSKSPIPPPTELFRVEEIIDRKVFSGKVLYKVKWAGYPIEEATWESIKVLSNSKPLIRRFKNKCKSSNREEGLVRDPQLKAEIMMKKSIKQLKKKTKRTHQFSQAAQNYLTHTGYQQDNAINLGSIKLEGGHRIHHFEQPFNIGPTKKNQTIKIEEALPYSYFVKTESTKTVKIENQSRMGIRIGLAISYQNQTTIKPLGLSSNQAEQELNVKDTPIRQKVVQEQHENSEGDQIDKLFTKINEKIIDSPNQKLEYFYDTEEYEPNQISPNSQKLVNSNNNNWQQIENNYTESLMKWPSLRVQSETNATQYSQAYDQEEEDNKLKLIERQGQCQQIQIQQASKSTSKVYETRRHTRQRAKEDGIHNTFRFIELDDSL